MTIEQAQQQVDEWIKTVGVRYFNELTNLGILIEETGELARLMVRKYGEQSFKESDKGKELADEMADVLWVLTALANQCGVNLQDALEKNMAKNLRLATLFSKDENLSKALFNVILGQPFTVGFEYLTDRYSDKNSYFKLLLLKRN